MLREITDHGRQEVYGSPNFKAPQVLGKSKPPSAGLPLGIKS